MLFQLFLICIVTFANAQVDQQRAMEYFKEAQALCERDNGRLWGIPICGPMVIFDRQTKTIAASKTEPGETRPQLLGHVNAPIQWGGETWASYIWNDVVTRSTRDRKELLIHEVFHCVQPQLKLSAAAGTPEHLDSKEGRYWLRLEWKALEKALRKSGRQRKQAICDALAFRKARRLLFPASVEDERGQEITEGLAAYTATVLVADSESDAIAGALDLLVNAEKGAKDASFVRTFAYISGPAYGLLLDASSPDWRKRIKNTDDVAELVMQSLNIHPSPGAAKAATRYEGAEILSSEEKREQDRQARLDGLRKTFVDGPTLLFPGGSHSYDTRGAVSLQGIGTIYFGPFRASGLWGKLEAEKGVLVSSDGRSRRVAAPIKLDERTYSGDGWKLYLSSGWIVKEGEKAGSFQVVKEF
ncbi:MAG TPA: hypothetical protein VGD22_08295 [Sphingobacteriaceae bacterium]